MRHVAQAEVHGEGAIETLRREITRAVHGERVARLVETAELRSTLEELQRHRPNSKPPEARGGAGADAAEARCEELARGLEAERECRCARNAELNARLGREVSSWTTRSEEQRIDFEAKIAAMQQTLETRCTALEDALRRERAQSATEADEFRATLDSMWKAMAVRPDGGQQRQRLFMDESGGHREYVGDSDDVLTLYDLVREAISDSTRLASEISDEREQRSKETEKARQRTKRLESRLNTVQTLVQSSMPVTQTPRKRPQRTLAQLAADAPQWRLLIDDPDGLFNPDDVIDEAYEKYLGDVLPFMIEHECTFKRGIEISAANKVPSEGPPQGVQSPHAAEAEASSPGTNAVAELTPGRAATEGELSPAFCPAEEPADRP